MRVVAGYIEFPIIHFDGKPLAIQPVNIVDAGHDQCFGRVGRHLEVASEYMLEVVVKHLQRRMGHTTAVARKHNADLLAGIYYEISCAGL